MVWEIQNRLTAEAEAAEPVLSDQLKADVAALCDKYPTKRAALLGALHKAQAELGRLSDQAMIELVTIHMKYLANVAQIIILCCSRMVGVIVHLKISQ